MWGLIGAGARSLIARRRRRGRQSPASTVARGEFAELFALATRVNGELAKLAVQLLNTILGTHGRTPQQCSTEASSPIAAHFVHNMYPPGAYYPPERCTRPGAAPAEHLPAERHLPGPS